MIVLTCAAVRSCGSPVPAVALPFIVEVAISSNLALLTTLFAIVVALLLADAVTSQVSAALCI